MLDMSACIIADAPQRLRALSFGPVAAHALRDGACGHVGAAFERSFYVRLGAAWVCVGPPALGDGPLNLLCQGWGIGTRPAAVLRVGDPVAIAGQTMRVGGVLEVAFKGVEVWRPQPPLRRFQSHFRESLATLRKSFLWQLPAEGVAPLLRAVTGPPTCLPPVAAAALQPTRYLEQQVRLAALGHAPGIDPDRLSPLLGLGPGLTPSGDDLLGGALVALASVGMYALRDAIWNALQPLTSSHTSAISAAHLAAAAEGYGGAVLHDLLEAVMTGRSEVIPGRLEALAAVGHSSGWDALTGAVAVLETSTSMAA